MRWSDGHFLFSPSDLTNFIGCEHLTQIEIGVAFGEVVRPVFQNAYAELISRKGDEHEQQFLEALAAAGNAITRVGLRGDGDFQAAAEVTAAAIRSGAEYIHQAVFLAHGWRGVADFLERVDRSSALGPWSYVVLDTKLARHPRPEHALQLCFYSQCLGQLQGLDPETAYIVLGTRERIPVRLANVSAYYRRLRRRFEAAVAGRAPTTPYPCDTCAVCGFRTACEEWWEKKDHLVRVAGIRRDQIDRLAAAGISTLTKLAEAPKGLRIPRMHDATFETVHQQAALQLERQRSGMIPYEVLPIAADRGLAALPRRSAGDIVLDLEGHPFYEPARGLVFLFGILTLDDPTPQYRLFWAHDRVGERQALEAVIDLIRERLARYPDLHVYHFGAYEPSSIARLSGEYATREDELDDLLRRDAFVNLYAAFRQAVRAGAPGYGLKDLEPLVGFKPTAAIKSGMDAIVEYEKWLATGDAASLGSIAAYNEDDCRGTLAVLEWLRRLRPSGMVWPETPAPPKPSDKAKRESEARERLQTALMQNADPGTPRWLAAHLLEYHRREARPAWWWYFARREMTPDELVEDSEAIGRLEPDPTVLPVARKRSVVHAFRFPPQDTKLGVGAVEDPATGKYAGEILEADASAGTLRLLRGPSLANKPLPEALIAGRPYDTTQQREAIFRFAASVNDATHCYPALEAVLKRDPPRIQGRAPGSVLQSTDLGEMKRLALGLEESYLFVQGPPGTGKTWTGGRLITHLLAHGKRVGIASQSHKAIHNLLIEVECAAREARVAFKGLKKSSPGNPESEYESEFITSEPDVTALVAAIPDVQLVAGTAWLFSRPDTDGALDSLVIDEAGQVSLADAIAMGTSARNVILLGDPLQLAQVSQGAHPAGTRASVLEHLLGDAPTVAEDRGLFLERSFRMHPDVCAFISEIVYAGRLHSDDMAARRTTSFGTGIRYIPVDHRGNRSASDEETREIAARIRWMLTGTFTDANGTTRHLRESDFMVLAPYNTQVNRLRAGVPASVKIGTVDKFQGQEAPIVFFSMATSSGEDVPRNLTFLFSRNRLNVAISRAQCLAFLVCSPRLLEARCESIEEMELVNALCRLVEYAESR